jgi:hypothetical protein
MKAAIGGHTTTAVMLLENKASIEAVDQVRHTNDWVVVCLSHHLDPPTTKHGWTVLMCACAMGHLETAMVIAKCWSSVEVTTMQFDVDGSCKSVLLSGATLLPSLGLQSCSKLGSHQRPLRAGVQNGRLSCANMDVA